MIRPSFAVIDFETTGFLPSDRVLEIGLALTDADGRLQRTWQTLVQPNRHFDNTRIHGIRPADVADAPGFAEVAAEFAALIDGRVIVAHNAPFDTKFLVREFADCGVDLDDPRDWSVCTMRTAKSVLPGAPQKLSECLSTIGAVNCNPHAALSDAVATAELLGDLLRRTDVVRSRTPLSLTPEHHRTLADVPALPPVERGHRSLSTVDGQWLDALAAGLPDTGDRDVDDYLMLLRAAMADGKLCTSEIRQLIRRAGELGIDREEAGEIHGRFVRQLAVEAWADGVVTDAEREAVTTAARQLGVDGALVDALLAAPVEGEGFGRLRLSPGDRVTFTGELALPREDWEQRARTAGSMSVASAVAVSCSSPRTRTPRAEKPDGPASSTSLSWTRGPSPGCSGRSTRGARANSNRRRVTVLRRHPPVTPKIPGTSPDGSSPGWTRFSAVRENSGPWNPTRSPSPGWTGAARCRSTSCPRC